MSGVAVSIGVAAVGVGMSFYQMSEQQKAQREAEAEADRAMAEAKKRLEINVYEKLGIAKLPYAQAREAALVQGAMATEVARESERGVAATAGRVQMAQQEMQADIAAKQEQEILNLEKLVATEEGRLLDIGTQLNLEEVAGAQMAAANAEERKNQALMQGMQGATQLAGQVAAAAPLYSKSQAVKQEGALRAQYDATVASGAQLKPQFYDTQGKPLPFQQALSKMQGPTGWDYAGIGTMKQEDYNNWLLTQKGSTFKNLGEGSPFTLLPQGY